MASRGKSKTAQANTMPSLAQRVKRLTSKKCAASFPHSLKLRARILSLARHASAESWNPHEKRGQSLALFLHLSRACTGLPRHASAHQSILFPFIRQHMPTRLPCECSVRGNRVNRTQKRAELNCTFRGLALVCIFVCTG